MLATVTPLSVASAALAAAQASVSAAPAGTVSLGTVTMVETLTTTMSIPSGVSDTTPLTRAAEEGACPNPALATCVATLVDARRQLESRRRVQTERQLVLTLVRTTHDAVNAPASSDSLSSLVSSSLSANPDVAVTVVSSALSALSVTVSVTQLATAAQTPISSADLVESVATELSIPSSALSVTVSTLWPPRPPPPSPELPAPPTPPPTPPLLPPTDASDAGLGVAMLLFAIFTLAIVGFILLSRRWAKRMSSKVQVMPKRNPNAVTEVTRTIGVSKPAGMSIGIRLRNGEPTGFSGRLAEVVSVAEDSVLESELQPGSRIVRINGAPVGNAKIAEKTLLAATRVDLEVLAPPITVTEVTRTVGASKPAGMSIGIWLRDGEPTGFSGRLAEVVRVAEDSVLASQLQPGSRIVRINGAPVGNAKIAEKTLLEATRVDLEVLAPPTDHGASSASEAPAVPPADLAAFGDARKSKWKVVRDHHEVSKVAMPWYKPEYWSNVTDEPMLSIDMPLSAIGCIILKRGPYYTLIYIVICLIFYSQKVDVWCYPLESGANEADVFPACDQNPFKYQRYETISASNVTSVTTSAWYTPWTAAFLHNSQQHCVYNVMMLLMFGSFLEFTEGRFFIMVIYFASAPLANGFHGLFSDTMIGGASGVIYALGASQVALVVMNWQELRREKWLRLLLLMGWLVLEVAKQATGSTGSTSQAAHVGGACIGIAVSMISAKNVKVTWYEPILIGIAHCMLVLAVLIMFGSGQWWVATLSLVVYPKVILDTYMYWRRATVLRVIKRTAVVAVNSATTAMGVKETLDDVMKTAPMKMATNTVGAVVNTMDSAIVTVNDVDDAIQKRGLESALVAGVQKGKDAVGSAVARGRNASAAASSSTTPTWEDTAMPTPPDAAPTPRVGALSLVQPPDLPTNDHAASELLQSAAQEGNLLQSLFGDEEIRPPTVDPMSTMSPRKASPRKNTMNATDMVKG